MKQIYVALTALTCGAAAPPAAAPPYFHGLAQGDGVTFVASPNNCALSILYDDFGLHPPLPGKLPVTSQTRRLTFAASGKPVATLSLRGAAMFSVSAPATIEIIEGGHKTILRPRPGENYDLRYTLRARGYLTPVTITLVATAIQPDTLLQLDSIDASIGNCKGKPSQ